MGMSCTYSTPMTRVMKWKVRSDRRFEADFITAGICLGTGTDQSSVLFLLMH